MIKKLLTIITYLKKKLKDYIYRVLDRAIKLIIKKFNYFFI